MIKFHHSLEKLPFSFFHTKSLCYNRSKAPLPLTKNIVHCGPRKPIRFGHCGSFVSILPTFHIVCGIFYSTLFAYCRTWMTLPPVLQKILNHFFRVVNLIYSLWNKDYFSLSFVEYFTPLILYSGKPTL